MNEEFRDVPSYEGLYQVSNLGNVKTVKTGRLRKSRISQNGYKDLSLHSDSIRKRFSIHQLVAMAFLNHQINGHKIVVDHINGNKLDNRVENLQLITNRENISKDKIRKHNLPVGVYKTKFNTYSTYIRENNEQRHLGNYKTIEEASNAYQNALKQLEY